MSPWQQIILALISTIGTVVSGIFASRSHNQASVAAKHADRAVAASMRPPGSSSS